MEPSPPPIAVDFPLRGEWTAANTPAERVPSHGTDQLGQRYAYDFIRIDRARRGWKFHRAPALRSLFMGAPLEDCYGWSAPIFAPFAGTVTAAQDGEPERNPVHLARDLALVVKNAFTFNPAAGAAALQSILGNHIVLRMDSHEVYAFLAHARCGSIRVAVGQQVVAGEPLAQVGHSGNSTAPHLHFQLMDGPNVLTAQGMPCAFKHYEALRGGVWTRVRDGLPGRREFVRHDA
jgi:murein DD-endopeptidase MepM/ murein hydrolase activator NlpD